MASVLIKKYGNRRLYDHTLSRPVTMDQLAEAVRGGEDIRVLDFNGHQIMGNFALDELGEPIKYGG